MEGQSTTWHIHKNKYLSRTTHKAQRVKDLIPKSRKGLGQKPSSIPGHTWYKERASFDKLSPDFYMHVATCMHVLAQVHTYIKVTFFKK